MFAVEVDEHGEVVGVQHEILRGGGDIVHLLGSL